MRLQDIFEKLSRPPEIKDFAKQFDDPKIVSQVHTQAARAKKSPPWKSTLKQMMAKYGFKLIGTGINGAVFENPAHPYVIKVYRTDQAYDEWLYFMRTNRGNKFIPAIAGSPMRINATFKAVRLERLLPCHIGTAIALTNKIEVLAYTIATSHDYNEQFKDMDPDLVAVAKFMRNWEDVSDMSPHNVMQRANGEHVIIDPLYSEGPLDFS